jgi:hypothetical protein
MQLQQAVNNAFVQLAVSLEKLTPEQYSYPCERLSHSTIGQHVRHIIEMFQCLEKGYETGIVNYENRQRDRRIETDKDLALNLLRNIQDSLAREDRVLMLEGVYNDDSTEIMRFQTNYQREIVYNLEHTIHHMALIRVGLGELTVIELPESYGVASATVKHKRTCAQ